MEDLKILGLRVRERLRDPEDGTVRVVEVLDGDTVLGQLPFTHVSLDLLARDLCKMTATFIVKRADILSHP